MIHKSEITTFSKKLSFRVDIVEKDYVLGWLLAGISAHKELSQNLIFKGGTCIKKCYLETYRLSEDLDYTVLDKKYLDTGFLIKSLNRLCIEILYQNQQSLIEPYAFRKNKKGQIVLYSSQYKTRRVEAFIIEDMQSVNIKNKPFTPRYIVEIR